MKKTYAGDIARKLRAYGFFPPKSWGEREFAQGSDSLCKTGLFLGMVGDVKKGTDRLLFLRRTSTGRWILQGQYPTYWAGKFSRPSPYSPKEWRYRLENFLGGKWKFSAATEKES